LASLKADFAEDLATNRVSTDLTRISLTEGADAGLGLQLSGEFAEVVTNNLGAFRSISRGVTFAECGCVGCADSFTDSISIFEEIDIDLVLAELWEGSARLPGRIDEAVNPAYSTFIKCRCAKIALLRIKCACVIERHGLVSIFVLVLTEKLFLERISTDLARLHLLAKSVDTC
jgi:hypothetical protein